MIGFPVILSADLHIDWSLGQIDKSPESSEEAREGLWVGAKGAEKGKLGIGDDPRRVSVSMMFESLEMSSGYRQ